MLMLHTQLRKQIFLLLYTLSEEVTEESDYLRAETCQLMREEAQSSPSVRKIEPIVAIFKKLLLLLYDIDKFYQLTVLLQQN